MCPYNCFVYSYPDDNCAAIYSGFGPPKDPQTEFPNYLTHAAGKSIVAPYLNSSAIALAAGKPFVMFETNTASCGGFPGISDSFGAALWAIDYGLQMAASNFSQALLHVGGQDVYYNVSTIYISYCKVRFLLTLFEKPFTRESYYDGLLLRGAHAYT